MIGGTPMTSAANVSASTTSNNVMVVNQAQPVVVVQQRGGDGCCSVPPGATCSVKATRCSSIAIIIIHAIAMVFAFINWVQWIASFFGIIVGSALLCNFNQCCYTTVAVLFSIGVVFDVIAAILWFTIFILGWYLAIFPILGVVAFLIGAISACVATCSWDENGSSDLAVAQSGPVQVSHNAAVVPSTHAAAVQPNYTLPVAYNKPPPAYSSGV